MIKSKLDYKCIKCLLERNLRIENLDIDEDIKTNYTKELIKIISDAPLKASSPEISEKINKLQNKYNIHPFDWEKLKAYYNDLILKYENNVWENIINSDDSFKMAISYALIGNFIDFGANSKMTDENLISLINDAKNVSFDNIEYKKLDEELQSAQNVVYLLDNCGEIVFDKLLIKFILNKYPNIKIQTIVRGENILNDVTADDAKQVGLDKITNIIPNGTAIAGTVLERINKEALNVIENADVIMSKGMGNFETLLGCNKNIYYIFMCKCEKFCRILNVPLYSYMLLNEKRTTI